MKNSEKPSAFEFAISLLARKDYSISAIASRLSRKGFCEEETSDVIEKLKEKGYLDDSRYAVSVASSSLKRGRGVGTRLKYIVRLKGIPEELASSAVSEVSAGVDTGVLAKELVEKRYPDLKESKDMKAKRRAFMFLSRRGFSADDIRFAINYSGE